ncbi:hypothetical protein C1I98_22510 [Spongiactinospora gelatinilytica]|uniref:RNA polymerase sigma-70 region 2 domain-containing protein n=1 Tax=Spongiactinospora gelatinilytica TaxID=2666298 RepID=A0A2W2FZ17_9ACTN|nr:hypothetical protein C1I98_22510 [Spongiactinospora gelatinilytica]
MRARTRTRPYHPHEASPKVCSIVELFETHRRHRWGVAYRILGTVADADDAMQETWPSAQTRTPSRTRGPV